MILFKKQGTRYHEASPAEIIHTALNLIRNAGHADLASATELKIIDAVFGPNEFERPGGVITKVEK